MYFLAINYITHSNTPDYSIFNNYKLEGNIISI